MIIAGHMNCGGTRFRNEEEEVVAYRMRERIIFDFDSSLNNDVTYKKVREFDAQLLADRVRIRAVSTVYT